MVTLILGFMVSRVLKHARKHATTIFTATADLHLEKSTRCRSAIALFGSLKIVVATAGDAAVVAETHHVQGLGWMCHYGHILIKSSHYINITLKPLHD